MSPAQQQLEPMRKALYYRLKLDSVNEVLSNSKYTFDYNEAHAMPNRFSYDTDYWGFYNGANNTSDLPRTLYNNRFYGEANKQPNLDYGITNALVKVTFPTKGTQEITYENDDYYFEGLSEDYQYNEFEINSQYGQIINRNYPTTLTTNPVFEIEYPFTLTGDVDQSIEFVWVT